MIGSGGIKKTEAETIIPTKDMSNVKIDSDQSKILVSVKDTGFGMSAQSMQNLFQKFSRAKNVSKLHVDGSGLGLFIAKQIIEAHNGRIWAESAGEGKGSQFYVELPMD